MRRLARLAACVLLFAAPVALAAPKPQPAPAAPSLQFVDLTPAFAAAAERTAALPDAERVAAFDAELAPLLPGFYDPARFKTPAAQDRYKARLIRTLNGFPA
jgi:hypothetical protein